MRNYYAEFLSKENFENIPESEVSKVSKGQKTAENDTFDTFDTYVTKENAKIRSLVGCLNDEQKKQFLKLSEDCQNELEIVFSELAAIMEFDGKTKRIEAEDKAAFEMTWSFAPIF